MKIEARVSFEAEKAVPSRIERLIERLLRERARTGEGARQQRARLSAAAKGPRRASDTEQIP